MKDRFGLTEERYEQLLKLYGDAEEVHEKVKDLGVDTCNKGYASLILIIQGC